MPVTNRKDFTYKHLVETSLHLTNVNHLAEFMLYSYAKKTKQKMVDLELNDQLKSEVIRMRIF